MLHTSAANNYAVARSLATGFLELLANADILEVKCD